MSLQPGDPGPIGTEPQVREPRRAATAEELADLCASIAGAWVAATDRVALIGERVGVLGEISSERHRQDAKWGEQNHPLDTWVTVLVEEVGEFAQDVLKGRVAEARAEMVQVAAVAVAIIEFIDRGKPALPHVREDERASREQQR